MKVTRLAYAIEFLRASAAPRREADEREHNKPPFTYTVDGTKGRRARGALGRMPTRRVCAAPSKSFSVLLGRLFSFRKMASAIAVRSKSSRSLSPRLF